MNNNFTPRAQQVLNIARREADRFHHNYIGAEHVLLGLLKLGQGVAISVMENAGVDIAELTSRIEQSIVPGAAAAEGSLPYTPRVRKMLIQAGEEAKKLRHTYVGTEHLLLAMLKDEDGLAWHSLVSCGLTYDSVRRGVMEEINPGFGMDSQNEETSAGGGGPPHHRRDEEEEEAPIRHLPELSQASTRSAMVPCVAFVADFMKVKVKVSHLVVSDSL